MDFNMGKIDIAWCPGCGNYGILKCLKETLTELAIQPRDTVLVSGIGQAAKTRIIYGPTSLTACTAGLCHPPP